MPNVRRSSTFAIALWVVLLLGSLLSRDRAASQTPTNSPTRVEINAEEASNFYSALNAVSARGQIAIVAEGYPLRPVLTADQAARIAGAGTSEEMVHRLADAFDYELFRDERGRLPQGKVYALRKRYTDPRDLPSVTFEECHAAVADIKRILSAFAPDPPVPRQVDLVLQIMNTLTPEQVERSRKEGIPVRALRPDQQAQIRRMASHLFVGVNLRGADNSLRALESRRKSTVCVRSHKDKNVVGFECVFPGVKPTFYPAGQTYNLFVFAPQGDELTELATLYRENAPATTLGAVVDSLGKNAPGATLEIDEILRDKPVCVAGMAFAPPERVMGALSDIYGLRLVGDSGRKSLALLRRRPNLPRDVSAVYDAVRTALPDPIRRATKDSDRKRLLAELRERNREAERRDIEAVTSGKISDEEAAKRFHERIRSNPAAERNLVHRAHFMGAEAARRVEYGCEQTLVELSPEEKQRGIPFSGLNATTRASLALVHIAMLVGWINELPNDMMPTYVRYLEHSIITTREFRDPMVGARISVMIVPYDSEGNPVSGGAGLVVPDRRAASAKP
jgi:hypothetical protein